MNALQRFSDRLYSDWLLVYCKDDQRNYDPAGFRAASLSVAETDARDCMLAIDRRIVFDTGGGRYKASRSSAHEVLFWEGHKAKTPRTITLWLEPVITFAALARLHVSFRWPIENLGTQPKGWAFDLAAYTSTFDKIPRILGEVKKTSAELQRLQEDLLKLSSGTPPETVPTNSVRKWKALQESKPALVWLVGPDEESLVYAPLYTDSKCVLREVSSAALSYSAA